MHFCVRNCQSCKNILSPCEFTLFTLSLQRDNCKTILLKFGKLISCLWFFMFKGEWCMELIPKFSLKVGYAKWFSLFSKIIFSINSNSILKCLWGDKKLLMINKRFWILPLILLVKRYSSLLFWCHLSTFLLKAHLANRPLHSTILLKRISKKKSYLPNILLVQNIVF